MQLFTPWRLSQILSQGDGRFWTWDKANGRLWLAGAASLAAELDVTRLTGRPVSLPLPVVTGDIGKFKAHLFASCHSGRKQPAPIARATMETLSGVPERTQRHYDRVAGVKRQATAGELAGIGTDNIEDGLLQRC